jgi:hypothetical protein
MISAMLLETLCLVPWRGDLWATVPVLVDRSGVRGPHCQARHEEYLSSTNPKCRLYLCFIEFIDWRDSQSCGYFRPALLTIAPL